MIHTWLRVFDGVDELIVFLGALFGVNSLCEKGLYDAMHTALLKAC